MNKKKSAFFIIFLLCTLIPYAQLTADFSTNMTSGCSPFIVQFTDQSEPSATIITRKWIFGNGNFSSVMNPQASYGTPGTYDVTLIVSDGVNYDTIIKQDFITVYNDPQPDFTTVSGRAGCRPLGVSFSDSSVHADGPVVMWEWDFGDGITSNDSNPVHIYDIGGIYPVSLHVVDANGCDNSMLHENYVNISETPHPGFSADFTNSCSTPFIVNFTNTSTGISALTYEWDFGDTTSSPDFEPQHTYEHFGQYTVSLVAIDSAGCRDTLREPDYIEIQTAVAGFTPNMHAVCTGKPVFFANNSIGSNSYAWDFGDGSQSVLTSPGHSYSNPGTFIVRLTASVTGSTCSDIHTDTITVESIAASYTYNPARYCEIPDTVRYSDGSPGSVTWDWRFGDTTFSNVQNPEHLFIHEGIYHDTLIVTSLHGCKDTLVQTVEVNIPHPMFGPGYFYDHVLAKGCAPLTVNFENHTAYNCTWDNITSYIWDFGDGNTSASSDPSHVYLTSGGYGTSLTVTTDTGCTNVYHDTIRVGDPPVADFTVNNDSVCASSKVHFYDLSIDSNLVNGWRWIVGDTIFTADNPVVTLHDTGYIDVTLIASHNGCNDTITKNDVVYINSPVADVQLYFSCDTPLTYHFSGNMKGEEYFYWDFGDGIIDSINNNPDHTYAASGNYMIILKTFNDSKGCTFFDTTYINVRNVNSQFTADVTEICAGGCVLFDGGPSQDAAYFFSGQTGLYLWNFDDSTKFGPQHTPDTITTDTISHRFLKRGTYHANMMVKGVNGCTDFMYKTIKVYQPDVNFTADNPVGCAPLDVHFFDQTISDTTISTWKWLLGNGVISNLQNPVNTYAETVNYSVTLTVTDTLGCSKTLTRPAFISIKKTVPLFQASDSTLCMNDTLRLINETADDTLTYFWDFGNGVTDTAKNPVYVYPDTGRFTISLTVTDDFSCNTVLTKTDFIHVQAIPQASFSADPLAANCYPLLVHYTDSSVSPFINQWKWFFDDGATSTLRNPEHNYTKPGLYNIKLTIQTTYGCSDTLIKSDYINVKGPYAVLNKPGDFICKDMEVIFRLDSVVDVDSIGLDFGDGIIVSNFGDSVAHTYTNFGKYKPTLVLFDTISGCEIYKVDSLVVNLITADFYVADSVSCQQTPVLFESQSFGESTYLWDFGDSTVAFTHSPQHSYSSSGSYDVLLVVYDDYSCRDSMVRTFVINPLPQLQVVNDTAICTGDTIILNAGSGHHAYMWSDNSTDSTHVTTAPALVSIRVQSDIGCWTKPDTVIIQEIPMPHPQLGPDTNLCTGDSLALIPGGSQWDTFLWQDSTVSQILMADTAGFYKVTAMNTCGQVSDSIQVTQLFPPDAELGNDTIICNGTTITLDATGYSYDQYLWTGGFTTSSITVNTDGAYFVTVTNICSADTDSKTLFQRIFPSVDLGNDTAICENAIKILHATGSAYDYYLWQDLSPDSVFTVDTAGIYFVRVTNECGNVSDTVFINEILFPHVIIGADTVICDDDSITLRAQTDTTYSYSWVDNSSDSILLITSGGTYSVTVTNVCSNAVDSIEILQRNPPLSDLSADTVICEGDTIFLNAQGYPYDAHLWGSGDTNAIHSIDTLGIYSVTVSNLCGSVTDSILISEVYLPHVNLGDSTYICNGDTIMLAADTGYTYVWQDSSSGRTFTVTNGGNFSVTVTNICASATDSIHIAQRLSPSVNIGNDTVICEGDTIFLNAQGYPYDAHLWGSGDTNAIHAIDTLGVYSVTVSNLCGSVTGSITVSEVYLPQVNLGDSTYICNGDTIMLAADTGYTYVWQDSSSGRTFTVTNGGNFSVTVTNICASANDTIHIAQRLSPSVNIGNDTVICEGDTIFLNAQGYPYDAHLWGSGDTNAIHAIDTLGIYSVTVSNLCGSITDSIIVSEVYLPHVYLGDSTYICNGDTIMLAADTGYTYVWQDSSSGRTFTVTNGGNFSVTVTNICASANDTIHIAQRLSPSVNIGNDTVICEGDTIFLNAQGYPYDAHLWGSGDTNAIHAIDTLGIYSVTVSNLCGSVTDSITVTEKYLPRVHLGADTIICDGTHITLHAGSGFDTYIWQSGDTTQTIETGTDSVYHVLVTNMCGLGLDSLILKILPITVDAGDDTSICDKTSASLHATNGFDNYLWDTGDTTRQTTVDSASTYTVYATNKCGTASDSVSVNVIPLPVIGLGRDTAISLGTILLNAGNPGATYQWSDGSTTQTFTVTDTIHKIWVKVTKDGCSTTDTMRILDFLQGGECTVEVPTAFSPNGDGLNDVLYVRGYCIDKFSFTVFNRFGQKVFETNDHNMGWDGFYKGEKQQTEVYIYYIWAKFSNDKSVVKKGNVTLLN